MNKDKLLLLERVEKILPCRRVGILNTYTQFRPSDSLNHVFDDMCIQYIVVNYVCYISFHVVLFHVIQFSAILYRFYRALDENDYLSIACCFVD